jgi:hypothetical protein
MLPSVSAHTDPVRAIARRFRQTLAAESRQHDNPEPLPARLARAAAVLPIEGVGLLLHKQPDRWTPLGASNETVALVQRLHDTVSDSPCQVAAETKSPVIATEELLTQRWPLFADLLLRQTPVRSMLVMPLSGRLHGRAFAVFCSVTPAGLTAIPMIDSASSPACSRKSWDQQTTGLPGRRPWRATAALPATRTRAPTATEQATPPSRRPCAVACGQP